MPDIERSHFGTLPDGRRVERCTLTNARGSRLTCIALGGTVLSLEVPDRDGALGDVLLGYDTLDACLTDRYFLGVVVGRYANRIGGAAFTLDGATYRLPANDGPNLLHGGAAGFHRALWSMETAVTPTGAQVVLSHTSPDGDQGFPGTLAVRVAYTLTDEDEWIIDYSATTDRRTPVALTQHPYFNLAGHGSGPITDHVLTLHASAITPVGASLIPTGELRPVDGTPFDFRTPARIGARIDAPDPQLALGGGYDHNFALDRIDDGLTLVARLLEPTSGRTLDVLTTEPGIQLYTGNALADGVAGKGGRVYDRRGGVCLETQHFPDSPNQPHFPSTILAPGERYASRTIHRFGTDRPRAI